RVPGTGGARVLRALPEELEAGPGLAAGTGPDLGPGRSVMPTISTELSPDEHAALTRWVSSAAVAAGIPGLDARQALHAMIKATVTDTTAAGVVLELLRRGRGWPVQLITVTLDDKTSQALDRWLARTA